MPNWCDNTLDVSHEDPKMIQMLEDAWKNDKFFGTIYPEPDYKTTPVAKAFPEITAQYAKTEEEKLAALKNTPQIYEGSWWDWRVKHWGTKWDIATQDHDYRAEANNFHAYFATAWSPPIGVYDKLVELGFSVNALYYEGGCAFCGQYANGADETYGIDGDWKEVKQTIPSVIDNEFDISEQMRLDHAYNLQDEIEEMESRLSEESDNNELIAELIAKKKELEECEDA